MIGIVSSQEGDGNSIDLSSADERRGFAEGSIQLEFFDVSHALDTINTSSADNGDLNVDL